MDKMKITEKERQHSEYLVKQLAEVKGQIPKLQKAYEDMGEEIYKASEAARIARIKDDKDAQALTREFYSLRDRRSRPLEDNRRQQDKLRSQIEAINSPVVRWAGEHIALELERIGKQKFINVIGSDKNILTEKKAVTFETNISIVDKVKKALVEVRNQLLKMRNEGSLTEIEKVWESALKLINEVDTGKSEIRTLSEEAYLELVGSLPSDVTVKDTEVVWIPEAIKIADDQKQFEKLEVLKAKVRK